MNGLLACANSILCRDTRTRRSALPLDPSLTHHWSGDKKDAKGLLHCTEQIADCPDFTEGQNHDDMVMDTTGHASRLTPPLRVSPYRISSSRNHTGVEQWRFRWRPRGFFTPSSLSLNLGRSHRTSENCEPRCWVFHGSDVRSIIRTPGQDSWIVLTWCLKNTWDNPRFFEIPSARRDSKLVRQIHLQGKCQRFFWAECYPNRYGMDRNHVWRPSDVYDVSFIVNRTERRLRLRLLRGIGSFATKRKCPWWPVWAVVVRHWCR